MEKESKPMQPLNITQFNILAILVIVVIGNSLL